MADTYNPYASVERFFAPNDEWSLRKATLQREISKAPPAFTPKDVEKAVAVRRGLIPANPADVAKAERAKDIQKRQIGAAWKNPLIPNVGEELAQNPVAPAPSLAPIPTTPSTAVTSPSLASRGLMLSQQDMPLPVAPASLGNANISPEPVTQNVRGFPDVGKFQANGQTYDMNDPRIRGVMNTAMENPNKEVGAGLPPIGLGGRVINLGSATPQQPSVADERKNLLNQLAFTRDSGNRRDIHPKLASLENIESQRLGRQERQEGRAFSLAAADQARQHDLNKIGAQAAGRMGEATIKGQYGLESAASKGKTAQQIQEQKDATAKEIARIKTDAATNKPMAGKDIAYVQATMKTQRAELATAQEALDKALHPTNIIGRPEAANPRKVADAQAAVIQAQKDLENLQALARPGGQKAGGQAKSQLIPVGFEDDGFRFKGGDASNEANWEKI